MKHRLIMVVFVVLVATEYSKQKLQTQKLLLIMVEDARHLLSIVLIDASKER